MPDGDTGLLRVCAIIQERQHVFLFGMSSGGRFFYGGVDLHPAAQPCLPLRTESERVDAGDGFLTDERVLERASSSVLIQKCCCYGSVTLAQV